MALIVLLVGQMFYQRLPVLISAPRDVSMIVSTIRYIIYFPVQVQNTFPDRELTVSTPTL